jgi:hypothetical protein
MLHKYLLDGYQFWKRKLLVRLLQNFCSFYHLGYQMLFILDVAMQCQKSQFLPIFKNKIKNRNKGHLDIFLPVHSRFTQARTDITNLRKLVVHTAIMGLCKIVLIAIHRTHPYTPN